MSRRIPASDSAAILLLVLILAGGMGAGLISAVGSDFWAGRNDFFAFYAGAKLAGSDQLYEVGAQYALQDELLGRRILPVVFIRIPFYALLLRPLAWLDYETAWGIFLLCNAGAAVWIYRRFLWGDPVTALLGAAYPPAYMALVNGQDVWLAAGIAAASLLWMKRGADFAGGLLFSLCLIKPHLFVFVPAVLAFHRKWRFIAGAACGALGLILLSFLAGGGDWVARYAALIARPLTHPGRDIMPNLWSLTEIIAAPQSLVWILSALAVLVMLAAARARDLVAGIAGALAGAVLVAPHVYLSDTILLLPAFAILKRKGLRKAPLALWGILLSPVPSICVALRAPWAAAAPLAILGALASLLPALRKPPRQTIPAEGDPQGA